VLGSIPEGYRVTHFLNPRSRGRGIMSLTSYQAVPPRVF